MNLHFLKTLTTKSRLKRAAKRVQAGHPKPSDLSLIAQGFQSDEFRLAPADQTISISGNANNALLIAGNGNVVFTLSGPAADTIRQSFLSSPVQIQKGCREVSKRLASELLGDSLVIRRKELEAEIDRFTTSDKRFLFIIGDSGVGKTVFASSESKRLSDQGWAVLLVRGATFSLDYMARLIAEDGLGQPLAPGALYVLRQPWKTKLPSHIQGFLVIVDDFVPEKSTNELVKLIDATVELPTKHVKVVVTCNSIAWERLTQDYHLPFHKDAATFRNEESQHAIAHLENFSALELDEALNAIGDRELFPARQGEWPDPHIESVRELLTHPATFGHYSHIRKSGKTPELENLTWSALIQHRLEEGLAFAANLSGFQPDALRNYLLQFAQLAVEKKSSDLRLSVDLIRQRIPELLVDIQLPSQSPLAALQQAGILQLSPEYASEKLIGFTVSDMGGYLLSFALQREAANKSPDELRQLVNARIQEAWGYQPLIDALLAWLDRQAPEHDNTQMLILLEALVETHLFRTETLFRLVRPSLISAIFDFIKQKETGPVFKYREAAQAIRPSPSALREIRSHLRDTNEQSQRVAVKLVGRHRDTDAIPILIDLLREPERKFELHSVVYSALASMRAAAIGPLIGVVTDLEASTMLRSRCLIAIRNIGTLTEEISTALTFCFKHARESEDELVQSALFTATHLRDCNQHSSALASLRAENWQSVIGATKIVMECGDARDLPALYSTLRQWTRPEAESFDRTWVIRQLMTALLTIEGEASQDRILGILRDGLSGNGVLKPVEAVWAADELDCPGSKALIFEDAIARTAMTPPDSLIWQSFNRLEKIWKPKHLTEIASATEKLFKKEIPVTQTVINAIRDGLKREFNHPLTDHHAQVAAFKTLAKSQGTGFGAEASELLENSEWTFDLTICDALWVLGDERAAGPLLQKANRHTSGKQGEWIQRSHAMRALSTCATEKFVAPLLSYIATEPEISLYLPNDTIRPLLMRGFISADQLKHIIRDSKATTYGRVACLQALAMSSGRSHADIFNEAAFNQDDEILQDHAVQILGNLSWADAPTKLRTLLNDTQSVSLAHTIAHALAKMNSKEAITDILKTRSRFGGDPTSFNIELARFGEQSALKPLLDVVASERHLTRGELNAVGRFMPDAQARDAILKKLEKFAGPQMDLGEQAAATRVLSRYDPALLVDRVGKLYRSGRLQKSARQELASRLPELIANHKDLGEGILGLLKLLICDPHLDVRRDALEQMFQIDVEIGTKVYEELKSGDEWSKACAVLSLGFWNSPEQWIQEARRDRELLIRRAADEALAVKARTVDLLELIQLYQSGNLSERLAAYLALEENGDYPTMWRLYDTIDQSSLAHVFLRELWEGMEKNSQARQQKAEKAEKDFLSSRGTVMFA